MDIQDLLLEIGDIANSNGISTPYIVGGAPRDRVMGSESKHINDLDITTGDDGSIRLGELLSEKLDGSKYRTYDDGHASLNYRGLKLDFSNNFISPGIDKELKKDNIII